MNDNKQVAVIVEEVSAPLSALAIRAQVQLIQEVMREVMQGPSKDNPNGVHFGLIPGCGDKPSLFKPGAEKLFLTFRLRPIIDPALDVVITNLPGGHRDYRVHCHILNMNGVEMATGVGSASTLESKHRYRNSKRKCPKCGAETIIKGREEYGGGWLCHAKIGGCGAKFADTAAEITDQVAGKSENPDIADQYNTVLKMACKRAKVDGCLSATACSDIFTQDIEDFSHDTGEPIKKATADPAPATHSPQRKSATSTLTPEQIEAKAAEAKARLHAEDNTKSETKATNEAPKAPADGVKLAKGCMTYRTKPNAGGYAVYCIEGQQDESGKDMRFSTKDPEVMATLNAHYEKEEAVGIEYVVVVGEKYTNYNIVGLVSIG